ncbi:MAG: gamma carbonic anhydrase family protein [Tetrasphaera sp.]
MPIYALGDLVPTLHPSAFIHPDAVVIGDVRMAAESSAWPTAVLRADFGSITVGARTSIQDGTVVHTTAEWPTSFGADCVVGHNAHVEGCTIEDRCLIGSGSVVLNRCVIGRGAIVAAGALVSEGLRLPAGALAVGVPARVIQPTDRAERDAWIDYGVGEYLGLCHRYPTELRRIERDEASTG